MCKALNIAICDAVITVVSGETSWIMLFAHFAFFHIYALPIIYYTDAHNVLCDAIAKVELCSNLQEVSRKKKSRRETKLMRRRV